MLNLCCCELTPVSASILLSLFREPSCLILPSLTHFAINFSRRVPGDELPEGAEFRYDHTSSGNSLFTDSVTAGSRSKNLASIRGESPSVLRAPFCRVPTTDSN